MIYLSRLTAMKEARTIETAEGALLAAARQGDAQAMERLLFPHQETLYRLCWGVLGHRQDAEDAVQETFLRAIRTLARFRGESSLRTWLSKIAVRVCLDWKRVQRPTAPLDEIAPFWSADAGRPETVTLERMNLQAALQSLMPRHRIVLLLKEQEEWSVAEIATALGCPPRRVYHELALAHEALTDWRRRQEREGA